MSTSTLTEFFTRFVLVSQPAFLIALAISERVAMQTLFFGILTHCSRLQVWIDGVLEVPVTVERGGSEHRVLGILLVF
jgi:hypothetical protein